MISTSSCQADLRVQHTYVALQYIGHTHGRSVLLHGLVVTIYIMYPQHLLWNILISCWE